MDLFIIFLISFISFMVILAVFWALSSCLGDEVRAHWAGRSSATSVPTTFGLQYARIMGNSANQAGWEQIEMEDMMDKQRDE